MAIRNSQDGISLVQTAESGMSEITNMTLRMRELAVQMENGIYTAKDRDNAQLEVNALLAEVDKIANNTRFNDVKVLDGSYDATIRAGNTNAETIRVRVDALSAAGSAKITGFVKNTPTVHADGVTSTGADSDLAARWALLKIQRLRLIQAYSVLTLKQPLSWTVLVNSQKPELIMPSFPLTQKLAS